jgi:hypothetical protein
MSLRVSARYFLHAANTSGLMSFRTSSGGTFSGPILSQMHWQYLVPDSMAILLSVTHWPIHGLERTDADGPSAAHRRPGSWSPAMQLVVADMSA